MEPALAEAKRQAQEKPEKYEKFKKKASQYFAGVAKSHNATVNFLSMSQDEKKRYVCTLVLGEIPTKERADEIVLALKKRTDLALDKERPVLAKLTGTRLGYDMKASYDSENQSLLVVVTVYKLPKGPIKKAVPDSTSSQ